MDYNMKTGTLGFKASAFLDNLAQKRARSFTLTDALDILGSNEAYGITFLSRLCAKGWIARVRDVKGRARYFLKPAFGLGGNPLIENWYALAGELAGGESYYLSHYTAMHLHNMTLQPLVRVFICAPCRSKTRIVFNIPFRIVTCPASRMGWGLSHLWVTKQDRVVLSDLERTILDCLWAPQYAGGIREIAQGIWLRRKDLNFGRISEYAQHFNKGVIYKRLGWLLEVLEIGAPPSIIGDLRRKSAGFPSYPKLDPLLSAGGKYRAPWRLRVNISEEELRHAGRT